MYNNVFNNTSLHVFYEGTLRSYGSPSCYRRYFTFEGIVYARSTTVDPYRHRHIEGHCYQLPKGHIHAGFWIGRCESYGRGNGYTGYQSMSRIVVELVPPPQA